MESLEHQIAQTREALNAGRRASSMSREEQHISERVIALLSEQRDIMIQEKPADGNTAFAVLKKDFDKRTKSLKRQATEAGKKLSNLFAFCEEVFAEGQEILILVTELTISHDCAWFIGRYGCKEYFAHNQELLFYQRQKNIISEMDSLDLNMKEH